MTDLVNGNLLAGVPFVITSATFRPGDYMNAVTKLAPHYVKMTKSLVGTSIEHTITEHLQLERHGIADVLGTEDARLGVTAFFSGEQPEFQGR